MAGEELQSALGGLAFSGMDNPYGIAASALGTATPGMISPYASTGQALGIGLGSILLQSLLGYQARQTALQDTLQANTLANQMLKLQTPEERVSFIGGLDESPAITGRLSNLSTALLQREVLQKNELDLIKKKRMAELGAAGEFYATPEGQAARQFEIDKIAEEAKARRTPLDEYLAREEARKTGLLELEKLKQTGRVDIETLKQTGRTDLQNLKDAAASGRAQDKLAWQEKQNQIDADLKRELVGLGVEAAVEKKRRIDELTMANRAAGQDPDLALVNAKRDVALELITAKEAAIAARPQPKAPSFWESIQAADRTKIATSQGQISAIRDLANTFEQLKGNALTLKTKGKLDPQSPENLALAKLNILVPSTARLMGEVGNLAQPEQERLIEATLGSVISGPKSIAARLRQLADTAEGIINSKTAAYKAAFETGGAAMLPGGTATTPGDEKLQILKQLQAELAAEKARRGIK